MRVIFLLLTMTLMGCMTTSQPSQYSPLDTTVDRMQKFPLLASPPNPRVYLDDDGTISRLEAEHYYAALEDYHVYLTSYLTYLDVKYKMGKGKRFTFTCTAIVRPAKIDLPPLPVIRDIPDDDIPDELLNHIGKLRTAIIGFNTEVDRVNRQIDKQC